MLFNFKLPGGSTAEPRRWPSAAFWLQASACAVVAWSLLHGGISLAPAPPGAALRSGAAGQAAMTAAATSSALPAQTPAAGAPGAGAGVGTQPTSLQLASTPSLEGAKLALTAID